MNQTPKTSTLTKVYHSPTKTGQKTQIAYVQSIPELIATPEEITYSALDIEDERMAKGRRAASAIEIPFLFTEEQWDNIKAIENLGESGYWFFQLPESTANTPTKPLTFSFTGECAVGMDAIEIDSMLQAIVKIYRDSKVEESKGFPE